MGSPPSTSVGCCLELVGSSLSKPLWVTLLWLGAVSIPTRLHPVLLLLGLPFLLVFGWIDLSPYTGCFSSSEHLTACSVSGWVITSQIQKSLNLVYGWLGSLLQSVALLLALLTLCGTWLTHPFAPFHRLWILLRCLSPRSFIISCFLSRFQDFNPCLFSALSGPLVGGCSSPYLLKVVGALQDQTCLGGRLLGKSSW